MRRLIVIALASIVIGLTPDARADGTPAPSGTPLDVRASHPVQLSTESSGSFGTRLFLFAGGLAAVAWAVHKRRGTAAASPPRPAPAVLSRTRIGLRNEVLVVEVGSQRFLLGSTAHSIQCLAELDPPQPERAQMSTGDRFEALLERAQAAEPESRRERVPDRVVDQVVEPEGQARGLSEWLSR
jgi:flagellar biogenesis protein FliO